MSKHPDIECIKQNFRFKFMSAKLQKNLIKIRYFLQSIME